MARTNRFVFENKKFRLKKDEKFVSGEARVCHR